MNEIELLRALGAWASVMVLFWSPGSGGGVLFTSFVRCFRKAEHFSVFLGNDAFQGFPPGMPYVTSPSRLPTVKAAVMLCDVLSHTTPVKNVGQCASRRRPAAVGQTVG